MTLRRRANNLDRFEPAANATRVARGRSTHGAQRMKHSLSSLAVAAILALSLAGCGKRDEELPRFNKQLGAGTAGLPVSTGSINTGLLGDPAAYKPITPPQPAGGPAGSGGGGAGGAFVAEEVQAAIKGMFVAGMNYDAQKLLAGINPPRIAALTDRSAIIDFFATLKIFVGVVEAKTKDKPDARMAALLGRLPERLIDSIVQSLDVQLLADDAAVATLNPEKLANSLEPIIRDMMTALPPGPAPPGAAPPGAAPPGAVPSADDAIKGLREPGAIPALPLSFRKVDAAWRLDIPYTLVEEDAELIVEGFGIARSFLAALSDKVEAANPFDEAMMHQFATEAGMSVMGDALGWYAKLQARIAEIMGATAPPAAAGEAQPTGGGRNPRAPGGP